MNEKLNYNIEEECCGTCKGLTYYGGGIGHCKTRHMFAELRAKCGKYSKIKDTNGVFHSVRREKKLEAIIESSYERIIDFNTFSIKCNKCESKELCTDKECPVWNSLTTVNVHQLVETIKFYANPETYFGIGLIGDAPFGEFMNDIDEPDPTMGEKPGKLARETLNTAIG